MFSLRLSRFALAAVLPVAAFCHTVAAHADTLDDIKSRGKMIVAIDPTFAPYEYTDANNAIVGYDPAILAAVAKHLGVTIEYQRMAFSGIIPGLLSHSFDLEGSALNVTAERAKRIAYVVPTSKTVNGALVRADFSKIAAQPTPESLAGLTGAVKTGSAPEQILKQFNETLKAKGLAPINLLSVDSVDQTVAALMTRRADFVFDDLTVLAGVIKQNPGKMKLTGELGPSQWISLATRPDDARLNQAISDQILAMKKSGELARLQKQYLGVTFDTPAADFIPAQ
ncbi:transporter substrate-binding domain-containing protein [Paraburkholderia caballeronis]|uniref:Amino acid ABC transporter substrate-binding protein, PAAT family n=1 Tax=Paraburkholderia caballeronis TaxID=416943 RepID=A0A1H7LYR2_9BURK|nr:transporter substrate-binding domain-containing protein [Paraburkholderia caballeronis]PXW28656.1 amino acid ABC transporter substrate-binding protein (PAAT family) [Paraburkholderia caballeronis]PXX04022.1 amino acid ABC transporter substrate-binding protein (PAAT family) [Paraburkholderia caballeronis]RAK04766.1 amino acid ABC transporter substrate-binding protein (PAAT family) [Paraburkholderia caballeronis]TDV39191.1 amino acid ABC transporter substrate-binding protein (PAAT family) [Par